MDPALDQSLILWVRDALWVALGWVIALFLIVAGVYMTVGPALRQGRAQGRVARALRKAGLPALNDLVLRGARGGLQQVDHVVRLPTGFVVLETCLRSGRLVGRPRGRVWRQHQGLDTYHFGNPLRRLGRAMAAVAAALPDPDPDAEAPLLTGQVVVPGRAQFPRGRPEGVSPLGPFLQDLRDATAGGGPPTASVLHGWRALQAAALTRADGTAGGRDDAGTGDDDAPAGWGAALRRTLRHLMADSRTAAGVVSTCAGGLMVLLLGTGLVL